MDSDVIASGGGASVRRTSYVVRRSIFQYDFGEVVREGAVWREKVHPVGIEPRPTRK